MSTYSVKLSQNPWQSAVVKAHASGDPAILRAKYDAETDPTIRATLAGEIRADVKFSTVGTYRLATMDSPTLNLWLSESDPAVRAAIFTANIATTAKGTAKSAKSAVTPKLDAYAEFQSALRARAIASGAVPKSGADLTGDTLTALYATAEDDTTRAAILNGARQSAVRAVMLAEFSAGILIWPNADRGQTVTRKLTATESANLAADSVVAGMSFDDLDSESEALDSDVIGHEPPADESPVVRAVKVPTVK